MSETGWVVESRDGYRSAQWRLHTPLKQEMQHAFEMGLMPAHEANWYLGPRKVTSYTLAQAMKLARVCVTVRRNPANLAPQTFRVAKDGQYIVVS